MMFAEAIKAGLPLIAVQTKDPLNAQLMMEHMVEGVEFKKLKIGTSPHSAAKIQFSALMTGPGCFWFMAEDWAVDYESLYRYCVTNSIQVIVVNPDPVHWTAFDAGSLFVSDRLMDHFLDTYVTAENREGVRRALSGLSYKAMVETARIAMATQGSLNERALVKVRHSQIVLSGGLRLVSPEQYWYQPPESLTDWLKVEGVLFKKMAHPLLRPRGLIFTGNPGTGKTSAAKFIAKEMGMPLYVLDIGGILAKYVGESENNLKEALEQAERLAPCVLLFDEVEKLFSGGQDSGVTNRLLSMLLWWLQEHQSQILTLMTTNNQHHIPPELYRPGRIDQEIVFHELAFEPALKFAFSLADVLSCFHKLNKEELQARISELPGTTVSQAKLTALVFRLVKLGVVSSTKE